MCILLIYHLFFLRKLMYFLFFIMIDSPRVMPFVISALFSICICIQTSKGLDIANSTDVENDNKTVYRECQLVEDCDFYAWFIENGTYRIPGFPKEIIEASLKNDECGLDQEGNVVKGRRLICHTLFITSKIIIGNDFSL